jgi:hypothetical protein
MHVHNVKLLNYFSIINRLLVYVLCVNWKYLELPLRRAKLMGQDTSTLSHKFCLKFWQLKIFTIICWVPQVLLNCHHQGS